MNWTLVFTLIKLIAPAIPTLYEAVAASMAGTPGAAKMEAFRQLVLQMIAVEQAAQPELASAFDKAWPMVQSLIESLHKAQKAA